MNTHIAYETLAYESRVLSDFYYIFTIILTLIILIKVNVTIIS